MISIDIDVCTSRVFSFRATLESYAKVVRGQGRSQYAPVYPTMTRLLKIGFGQL